MGKKRKKDHKVVETASVAVEGTSVRALETHTPIAQHTGKKYLRQIHEPDTGEAILVDVYSVLVGFGVTCPGRQQAIKKLLATGQRGKGDALDDLIGAQAAVNRAIDMEKIRLKHQEEMNKHEHS